MIIKIVFNTTDSSRWGFQLMVFVVFSGFWVLGFWKEKGPGGARGDVFQKKIKIELDIMIKKGVKSQN